MTTSEGEGDAYVVEYFEGNVAEMIVTDNVPEIAPIAGTDNTPPDPAANDNSSPGGSAA